MEDNGKSIIKKDFKNRKIAVKLKALYDDDPVDRLRGKNIVSTLRDRGWNISLYHGQEEIDLLICLDSLNTDDTIDAKYRILDIQDNHLNRNNPASIYMKRVLQRSLKEKLTKVFDRGLWAFVKRVFLKGRYENSYLRTLEKADCLLCSSDALREYFSAYHSCVRYIPDPVEASFIQSGMPPYQSHKKVSICWTGTENNIAYLKLIDSVIGKLQKRYDIEFTIISSKNIFSKPSLRMIMDQLSCSYNFIEWDKEHAAGIIQQHDIGIAPLPEGSEKSTNKILAYMALKVATVCSGAKDYAVLSQQYGEGFLFVPNDPTAWEKSLEKLITDSEYRAEMAEKGYALAQNFTLEKIADLYEMFFEEILGKKIDVC